MWHFAYTINIITPTAQKSPWLPYNTADYLCRENNVAIKPEKSWVFFFVSARALSAPAVYWGWRANTYKRMVVRCRDELQTKEAFKRIHHNLRSKISLRHLSVWWPYQNKTNGRFNAITLIALLQSVMECCYKTVRTGKSQQLVLELIWNYNTASIRSSVSPLF